MKHSYTVKSALSVALLGFLALGLAPVASAATTTTTFSVTANVGNTCTLSATTLAFNTVVPSTSTFTNAQSTINLNCSSGDVYTIALNAGTGTGELEAGRFMTGTAHGAKLNYMLSSTAFTGPGAGTNWGTTNGTVGGTGTGANVPITVYGQILEQTAPVNDNYSDLITVTVTY